MTITGRAVVPLLLLLSPLSTQGSILSDIKGFFSPDKEAAPVSLDKLVNRNLAVGSGTFLPNSCSPNACVKWSSVYASSTISTPVVIDCNTCLEMDYTDNTVVTLESGLNIIGELRFPSGTIVTLKTPSIIVQGKLSMTSDFPIDGKPYVKVVLTGEEDVILNPAAPNTGSCPAGGCNLGPKAVVVAGGTLDISGMPADCPSWSVMEDDGSSTQPVPETFDKPMEPVEGCPSAYVDESFDDGENGWFGNVGAMSDASSGALVVSGRKATWQGPMVEVDEVMRNCLVPDTDLVFTMKVKLSKADGESNCATSGLNCPELKFTRMDSKDRVLTWSLAQLDGEIDVTDGEWFRFAGNFEFRQFQVAQPDIFTTLSISGPEKGVDITIDDVYVGFAPPEAFPDPEAPCGDLVPGNGDAELGFPFPFVTYDRTPLKIMYENGNAFFRVARKNTYSSIVFPLNMGCTPATSIYAFSAKVRLHSSIPTVVRFMLKTWHDGGPVPASLELLVACPESSSEIGWVTCSANWSVQDKHADGVKLEVFTIVPGDTTSVLDYDDLQFTFKSAPSGTGLKVAESAASCWAPGAELVVTSQTINYNNEQMCTIETIDDTGLIKMTEEIQAPTPSSKYPEYASSFALLSRNIVFEAEVHSTKSIIGGSFTILRTPSQQKLDGVAFVNFGQQGVKGRYPIHLYQGGASTATISRNAIVNSNSRCVVLAGVQGVTVEDNVAYNIFGHCYALEDGSETNNVFKKNLGAKIMRASVNAPPAKDHSPAVFLIKNPDNTYEGNIAAGSQDSGYYFETDATVIGDSTGAYTANPSTIPVKSFTNNAAHSNMGEGLKFISTGYNPTTASVISNFRAYRNRGSGVALQNTKNINLENVIVADNSIGINIILSESIKVSNARVEGYSESFKDKADAQGLARFCWGQSGPLYGVSIHPNTQNVHGVGATLEDVTFSRFRDDLGCIGSAGIVIGDDAEDKTFSATTNFVRVGLAEDADENDNLISACAATNAVIHDVKINDDGSLNPDGTGPGYIVSDNAVMTSIAGICAPIEGTCLQYCYGQCLRKVQIGLDTENTEDYVLEVDDGSGVTSFIQGTVSGVAGDSWAERRFYVLDAPVGTGKYIAQFKKNGVVHWPIFAEVDIEDEPICTPYWTNFTLIIPPPEEGDCDVLVRNGDFDSEPEGTLTQWHHTGGGIKLVPGVTGMALGTVERWNILDGFAQYIDTRCLQKGQIYKFTAMAKMWNPFDMPVCNPNQVGLGGERCLRGNIKSVPWEGEVTYHFDFAVVAYPYQQGKWNQMHGVFKVSDDMVGAQSVVLYFDGVRDSEELMIDDVKIFPIETECPGNIIRNGDLETGDTMWWRFIGTQTALETVSNAPFGEEGYSATTKKRQFYFHGPTQLLNTDCISPGDWYEVSGRYRLYDMQENELDCDPYYGYIGVQTCPAVQLRFFFGFNETFRDIGPAVGPFEPSNWNYMYGTFQADEEVMKADRAEIYVANAKAYTNILFDDIVVKKATPETIGVPSCSQLIKNPDAETGDARSWMIKGTGGYGTIEIVSPGAEGSQYAFHHTGKRDRNFNGMWQYLDQRCMPIGSKWKVSGYFQLFDDNGNPFTCDKTKRWGDLVCPQILIQSTTLGTPYSGTGPLLNGAAGNWVPDAFNYFEAYWTMDEGHKVEDKTWMFVHNIRPGFTYYADNIKMERVS